ncbi:unnamed protein product [Urochloa humidicola]
MASSTAGFGPLSARITFWRQSTDDEFHPAAPAPTSKHQQIRTRMRCLAARQVGWRILRVAGSPPRSKILSTPPPRNHRRGTEDTREDRDRLRRRCRRRDLRLAAAPAPAHPRGGEVPAAAARAHTHARSRSHSTTAPEEMEDKSHQDRPLVLPPNTNGQKSPTLKRPVRTLGNDVGLSSGKFVVPFSAPTEPVVAEFNKVSVQIYNTIAGIKGLLEEVNAADPQLLQAVLDKLNGEHPELLSLENKERLCSILRKGIHHLRNRAYTFRCFVMGLGLQPINEPLDWKRT